MNSRPSLLLEAYKNKATRISALPRGAVSDITVMLSKPAIDAVEALLEDRATRIGILPADIRRYVLIPYLWDKKQFVGIPHRNGFRYGIMHFDGKTARDIDDTRRYYHYGRRHRVGAPAVINRTLGKYEYFQDDRRYRESGPVIVKANSLVYRPGVFSIHMRGNLRWIKLRNEITLYHYRGLSIQIGVWTLHLENGAVFIYDATHAAHIKTYVFEEAVDILEPYLRDYPIAEICATEYARTLAEMRR